VNVTVDGPEIAPALIDSIGAAIEGLQDEIVGSLGEAIRIRSINPSSLGEVYDDLVGAEGDVSRYLAGHYRQIGAEVELLAFEAGRENAVGVMRGTGNGRSLIFNGHIAVVPPGNLEAWSNDPFSGHVAEGRVWGRGAADMKAGVIAQTFAARVLHELGIELNGDLILEAVVGEERGEHKIGTTALIEHGFRADGAVVAEPTSVTGPLGVMPVSSGILGFRLSVPGKTTHAGMRGASFRAGGDGADIGVSAIDKGVYMFGAIRQLEDEWGITKRHPLYPPGFFSMLPGYITGGAGTSTTAAGLADHMDTVYSVWFPPGEEAQDVRDEIDGHIARAAAVDSWLREHPPTVDWHWEWPPGEIDSDHPLCATVLAAHAIGHVGTPMADGGQLGGAPYVAYPAWILKAGIPALLYGPGEPVHAHAADESVGIDELLAAVRTYALTAMSWCGYRAPGAARGAGS